MAQTAIDQYAVVGNPIAHSKSPFIHQSFAKQTQETLSYGAICADVDGFTGVVDEFMAGGGRGLNITVPFKLEALERADTLSERAKRAGAVNTLVRQEDGSLLGENTDGLGLVRDLIDNLGWALAGKRVLIIGAGGAVRGVLEPILSQHPAELVIANRTLAKAQQLATEFADLGNISASEFEALCAPFDIIINASSASLAGELPPLPQGLAEGACCYDMMYAASATVFMQWAQEQGATASADGLGMLIEQAAESFRLWRGVKPQTQEVMDELRRQLSS